MPIAKDHCCHGSISEETGPLIRATAQLANVCLYPKVVKNLCLATISLTLVIGKLFIICWMTYLESNVLLADTQAGFKSGRSRQTQPLEAIDL